MTCESIITAPPARLNKADTIDQALAMLKAQGASTLPVVDGHGRFVGVFGMREVVALLLPKAVRLGDDLGELGFLSDSPEDLRKRLGGLGHDPVGKHLAPHRAVRSETPLVEALLLLYRGDAFLAVVDEGGRLTGVVTAADALTRIMEAG